MAKVKLGAKVIADRRKADAALEYWYTPDIVIVDGDKRINNATLKDDAIQLKKRYLTAGERAGVMMNADASMPIERVWEATVLEVKNLDRGDGQDATPSEVLNAVGSQVADALIMNSYIETIAQTQLSEDERKN